MNTMIDKEIKKEEVILEALPKEAQTIDGAIEFAKKKDPKNASTVAYIVSEYLDKNKKTTDAKKGLELSLLSLSHPNIEKNFKSTVQKIENYLKTNKAEKYIPSKQKATAIDKKSDKETVENLAKYGMTDEIRSLAIYHPNTSEKTIETIAKESGKIGDIAKALKDADDDNVKQKRIEEIYKEHVSKSSVTPEEKQAFSKRLAENPVTSTTILTKIAKESSSDEVKKSAEKSLKRRSGIEASDNEEEVTGYSAELSLNKIVGRLHDVAIEAIKNKYKSVWSRLKSFFGGASAMVINNGMFPAIPKQGESSTFRGVSNTREYSIFVIPTGLFGKKDAVVEALKLYLKYFTGEDVDVKADDIATQGEDLFGRKTNIWAYNYRIVYKIYKEGEDFKTLLGESKIRPITEKENAWLKENMNPFNHFEKIFEEKSTKDFVKMVNKGENLKAKQLLEKILKEKAEQRKQKVLAEISEKI